MAPKYKDITGRRSGKLTAIHQVGVHPKSGYALWFCQCDCGNPAIVSVQGLSGGTKSCGCILREKNRNRPVRPSTNKTHGESGGKSGPRTPEFVVWLSMRQRCSDPKNNNYPLYGGRGIRVCEAWQQSYETFLSDMGRKPFPRATIDRVNPQGNYTPENCRWASYKEQANNRRNNVFVVVHGERMSLLEAVHRTKIPERTLYRWAAETAPASDISNLISSRLASHK